MAEEKLTPCFDDNLPLRVLPKRWDHGWPRYLYRYTPEQIATHDCVER